MMLSLPLGPTAESLRPAVKNVVHPESLEDFRLQKATTNIISHVKIKYACFAAPKNFKGLQSSQIFILWWILLWANLPLDLPRNRRK